MIQEDIKKEKQREIDRESYLSREHHGIKLARCVECGKLSPATPQSQFEISEGSYGHLCYQDFRKRVGE
jgi:hypothetical protein